MNMKKRKDKEKPTINVVVFVILRFLVILSMIAQGLHGNWNNVFLCLFTLLLFTVPVFVKKRFKIELPKTLEIIIYLFIFSAEILGEIQNFYGVFKHWDTLLHTLNGFLCAAVGFSLVDNLNRNKDTINMAPMYVALVSICFSMTVGVMWEFLEYAADTYFSKDMQKDTIVNTINSKKIGDVSINEKVVLDNINKTIIYYDNDKEFIIDGGYLDIGIKDTMKDLFVNFIGALVFSFIGFLYVKDRDEYKFVEKFLPMTKKLQE